MEQTPQQPHPAAPVMHFDPKDVEDNKVMAALSYLGLLVLIPLLLKKDSPFVKEHAKQGLVMLIAGIVGSFVFWFPFIGWALGLAFLIVDLYALIQALSGKFWEVPVLGAMRKNFNI